MKLIIYNLLLSMLFLTACSNNDNKTANNEADSVKKEEKIVKSHPTGAILAAYLKLKNELSADNDQNAAKAGDELLAALNAFDTASLSAEQQKKLTEINDDAKEHAAHIGANVGNIVHQREHFDMLSKDMYDLVKLLGSSELLYVDHCPMYNNNKGAIWLSEVKEIKNPYMGKAMPTCGSVKEELK